jgi:hypothetical protein
LQAFLAQDMDTRVDLQQSLGELMALFPQETSDAS